MFVRYFYVPKGTKEIRINTYSGHASYKLHFKDPDGNLVQSFMEGEEITPIPVADGTDGRPWQLDARWFAPKEMAFENLPNYLAASPNALLLPKQLVIKDKLIHNAK